MSRPRYDDTRSAGSSREVPFIHGESTVERHNRRATAAASMADTLYDHLKDMGWELRVTNHGSHYIMTKGKNTAEWWPRTAKLVINKKWKGGIHCHDIHQVLGVIKTRVKK